MLLTYLLPRTLKQSLFNRSHVAARRRGRAVANVERLEPRVVLHANSVLTAEHLTVFGQRDSAGVVTGGLVPNAAVTNYNLGVSGFWDDANNWSDGVPDDNDNVLILPNTEVIVRSDASVSATDSRVALRTIRVDGKLTFRENVDTKLLVDTIVVQSIGSLQIGTDAAPVSSNRRAKIIFADLTRELTADEKAEYAHEQFHWDPLQFSHGLLSHGTVSIHGANVTSFVSGQKLIVPDRSTTFDLGVPVPADWRSGDRLIISGGTATNGSNVNQDDQVQIAAISGNVITLSPSTPLKYAHYKNSSYVANMNRNVTFESETPGVIAQRGHVMFMHSDRVEVESAGFYGLGRTDKRTVLDDVVLRDDPDHPGHKTTDVLLNDINPSDPSLGHRVLVPVVDANGATVIDPATGQPKLQIARTGLNQRGRYAVHFHRTGTDYEDDPVTISNSVVVDSPGWGIVNHSSYVDVLDNVVFNATGAAFVTEAGDEIGRFDRNLAMHSLGSGMGVKSREAAQDFGHQGDGFWLQGGNVSVTNNVASGQRHSGFVFFPKGLIQGAPGETRIAGANLAPHYAWADPARDYDVADVPLLEFSGNTVFGSFNGFESWFTLLHATHNSRSVIDNFKVFSVTSNAIEIPYTRNMTLRNVTLTGNPAIPRNVGIQRNAITQNITYDHISTLGFEIGISAPLRGTNSIIGGRFNNLRNINIVTAADRDRVIEINDASPTDPVKFVNSLKPLVNRVPTSVKQYDIYMDANFRPLFNDITTLFNPDVIRIGLVTHNGQQVYFHEQAAGFTPFPSTTQFNTTLFGPKAAAYVPAELLDKTNAQLVAQYGLAIAGIIAPANAIPNPHVNGIVGPAAQYPVNLHLFSPTYYNDLISGPYKLTYGYTNPATNQGVYVSETTATPLHNGWNVITRQVLGQPRSFLIFSDDTPPSLQLSANMPGVLNKADLDNGSTLMIDGQLVDNSFGTRHFQQTIKLNDANYVSALKTRADGSQYVTITIIVEDRAKNKTTVHIDLAVTLTATLLKDIGRRDDPFFVSSETLLALLGI